MSNLSVKRLCLLVLVSALLIVSSFFVSAEDQDTTSYCYVSPDFSTYFSSNSNLESGSYLIYNKSCSNLSSYFEIGCCIATPKDSNLHLATLTNLGKCEYVIGPKSSSSIFLPGVTGKDCSLEAISHFNCSRMNKEGKLALDDNSCIPHSIYYCNLTSGRLIADCSRCSACSDANLSCDSDTGYCVSNLVPHSTFDNDNNLFIFTGHVNSSQKAEVPGANVFFFSQDDSSSYSAITNSTGGFSLSLPSGLYDIFITAEGYTPLQDKITVSSTSSNSKTFTLSTSQNMCDLNKVVFEASHTPGKPWITLKWVVPQYCSDYSVSLSRNGTILLQDAHVTSFVDKELSWENSYTYTLNITLNSGASKEYSLTIYSGDSICEGSTPGYEFCYDSAHHKSVQGAVLRGTCDNNNHLIEVSSNDYPSNCSSYETGAICAPAPNHKTICVPSVNCSSLGGKFGLDFSKDTCLEDNHYCYYDFSNTVVDVCYNCFGRTCFDFNSEDACLDNNCGLDCYWVPVNDEFNKGLCLPAHGGNFNKCDKCNALFMNCSAQDCSYLGNCFLNTSNGRSCDSCPSDMTCSAYSSQDSCVGSSSQLPNCAGKGVRVDDSSKCCPGLTFLPLYDTSSGSCLVSSDGVCTNTCGDGVCEQEIGESRCNCPQDCSNPSSDAVVSYVESQCSDVPKVTSFDSCGLGVCKWSDNKCSSVATNDADVHRPTITLISSQPIRISQDNHDISFNFDSDYSINTVTYAISKYKTCPNSANNTYYSLDESTHELTFHVYKYLQDHQTGFSGAYYLIFYIKDVYGLGSLPVVVPFYYAKTGLSFTDFDVHKGLDKETGSFNVLVNVKLSKNATCSYEFTNSSGSDVSQLYESTNNFEETSPVKTLLLSRVPAGNYQFSINCSDSTSSISYRTQISLIFNPNFDIAIKNAPVNALYYGNYPLLINGRTYTVTLVYNKSVTVNNVYAYIFNSSTLNSGLTRKVIELSSLSNETKDNVVVANYSLNLNIPEDYFKNAESFVLLGEFYINATKDGKPVPSTNIDGEFFKVLTVGSAPVIHIG